jgi:nitroreductase
MASTPYPPPGFEDFPFVEFPFDRLPEGEMRRRAGDFYALMERRRSIRDFSPDPVPADLIRMAIRTASTAPSGAHHQPWTFVLVGDRTVKHAIRQAAEEEERIGYSGRMSDEWLQALRPLATTPDKSHLDVVPWLVVVFEERYGLRPDGSRFKHYYVRESVGIACGLFIAALHNLGLATLTHTPSPMGFLSTMLERPPNEAPFVLFPIGYPADHARVPDLRRKSLAEVLVERC